MKVIRILRSTNCGSAIAEFLIFTLPFFTTFLVLITTIQNKSMAVSESNNLARQAVRAYVSSPTEQLAMVRAQQVIEIYQSKRSQSARQIREIELDINCNYYPCFMPGNSITATVTVSKTQKSSATEYVDLWR